jgi:aminoglycoside phosphotransferase family enzyme
MGAEEAPAAARIDAGRVPVAHRGLGVAGDAEATLDQKVAFLSRPGAYTHPVAAVTPRETHMSWVFLAGNRAYKLKKPVHFPYLDFASLDRRERACRAELGLNRRLASDVYLDVVPLTTTANGLAIGGDGAVADWLVVMRRLDETGTLEHAILEHRVERWQLDRLIATLIDFYRRAPAVFVPPARHARDWRQSLADNRRVLLEARLGLPAGLVRRILGIQHRFVSNHWHTLAGRVRARRIVEGHGDLRPEHIWLGDPVRIIDCLEFNPRLRAIDQLDEIAFLSLECDRLGAAWVGEYIRRGILRGLPDGPSAQLLPFYRCHRATLRARLAIAHLLEPNPRTPEKWPRLARAYLRIAAADAFRLERSLKIRKGRPAPCPGQAAAPPRRAGVPPAARRPCYARGRSPVGRRARHP